MDLVSLIIIVVITLITLSLYKKYRQIKQLAYIKKYHFHKSIKEKIRKKYPHLSNDQVHQVFKGLRDYFWMCNRSKRKMVSMPSQVVDDAWHEFILFTRSYKTFCKNGVGKFLHHTPTEAMASPTLAQEGIKRAWRLACAKENINPRVPNKLPLIFALDSMLSIPNGFTYSLNCKDKKSPASGHDYCAGHIACSSGCAGDSGASNESGGVFDGFFDSSGGVDCGGGCGGD